METVNLDVSKYIEARDAGQARFVNIDGTAYFSRRQFNPATGEPVPQLVPLSKQQIENSLEQAREAVRQLEALKADFEAAQKK